MQTTSLRERPRLPIDNRVVTTLLGECRTLLGKREQAIHSFNLYQRLFSEVSDHSTQVAWHVAEQSLSLYSLQKCLTA